MLRLAAACTRRLSTVTVVRDDARKLVKASVEFAGRRLALEQGRIAPLADSAVLATYGDTSMLVTAVSPMLIEGDLGDGLPLSVDYREMSFAAGMIPGSFTRRESKYGRVGGCSTVLCVVLPAPQEELQR